jgi:hypothetical protein
MCRGESGVNSGPNALLLCISLAHAVSAAAARAVSLKFGALRHGAEVPGAEQCAVAAFLAIKNYPFNLPLEKVSGLFECAVFF